MTELTLQRQSDGLEASGPPKSKAKPATGPYGRSWWRRISPLLPECAARCCPGQLALRLALGRRAPRPRRRVGR
jgi:hypothetical protein